MQSSLFSISSALISSREGKEWCTASFSAVHYCHNKLLKLSALAYSLLWIQLIACGIFSTHMFNYSCRLKSFTSFRL